MAGCNRFDAKVVPIAVEIDQGAAQHPEGAHLRGTALRDRQVGATLLCSSMFGKTDATVTGGGRGRGGRYVVRGLICDDGLWFSVKPDG